MGERRAVHFLIQPGDVLRVLVDFAGVVAEQFFLALRRELFAPALPFERAHLEKVKRREDREADAGIEIAVKDHVEQIAVEQVEEPFAVLVHAVVHIPGKSQFAILPFFGRLGFDDLIRPLRPGGVLRLFTFEFGMQLEQFRDNFAADFGVGFLPRDPAHRIAPFKRRDQGGEFPVRLPVDHALHGGGEFQKDGRRLAQRIAPILRDLEKTVADGVDQGQQFGVQVLERDRFGIVFAHADLKFIGVRQNQAQYLGAGETAPDLAVVPVLLREGGVLAAGLADPVGTEPDVEFAKPVAH